MQNRLNLGCGTSKIPGCINVDVEPTVHPDLICNFLKDPLPYIDGSIDEVYLFHTIEHIKKPSHWGLLAEIWRVMKPSGLFLVSFPEFTRCYKNWETNARGQKNFWEATIFGRQLYSSDHHVCIMDSVDFSDVLRSSGFDAFNIQPEPHPNEFNTVISCRKGHKLPTYESVIRDHIDNIKFSI